MTSPNQRAVSALHRTIDPARVLTGGPAYEKSRAIWNGAITHRPAIIVRCGSTDDVRVAVQVAREFALPLSVRGGGHDWAGRALRPDGLVLDLTTMNQVDLDAGTRTATIGGGTTSAQLVSAAAPFGLVAVTGAVGAVGMIGLTLGGGYSPLSGRFGLAADNLISAEVVLADGTVVTADSSQEPDLLWALRGGGGNFGVVTSARIQLHEVPTVVTGRVMYPISQAVSVLNGLNEVQAGAPDELTVQSGLLTGPTGEPVVFLMPTWCGDPDAADLEPLTRFGTPVFQQIMPMPYATLIGGFEGLFPDGLGTHIATRTVPGLEPDVVQALHSAMEKVTSPRSAISLDHLHGAATRVPVADTAFATRRPHLVVEIIGQWTDDDEARHRAWVADADAALVPLSLPGGYLNLVGPDETGRAVDAYGPNASRLMGIKKRFDPDSVFNATALPRQFLA